MLLVVNQRQYNVGKYVRHMQMVYLTISLNCSIKLRIHFVPSN